MKTQNSLSNYRVIKLTILDISLHIFASVLNRRSDYPKLDCPTAQNRAAMLQGSHLKCAP
uniref:Uncharacterized protein n=1 Tax=Siphoviridae sp. ctOba29 TaxID=2825480 RepID=A0A8S5NW25_9CAUD|nr:MAG TPA: hypothetical protein [Siphoviridae sp. ctOba29]